MTINHLHKQEADLFIMDIIGSLSSH